jgi:beta-1,4-N-acetylglucosaminyltransferase
LKRKKEMKNATIFRPLNFRTFLTKHTMHGSVLVTVGSTQFDKLVAVVCSPSLQQLLISLGYSQLTIQHGKSPISSTLTTNSTSESTPLQVTSYPYKPSLHEDMEKADLIISHAGKIEAPFMSAESGTLKETLILTLPTLFSTFEKKIGSGSILEALRLNKKLVVVVNEGLMDNHQMELGSALHEQHYLVCCTVS